MQVNLCSLFLIHTQPLEAFHSALLNMSASANPTTSSRGHLLDNRSYTYYSITKSSIVYMIYHNPKILLENLLVWTWNVLLMISKIKSPFAPNFVPYYLHVLIERQRNVCSKSWSSIASEKKGMSVIFFFCLENKQRKLSPLYIIK